ncbi:MAG: hypothetical protein FJ104_08015 [Deltaproteobacteria bacterium]|nr:hypothetical protein [Deltaproteobacteria bacterium]
MGLAEGCNIDSDCDDDLICGFRRCHVQCSAKNPLVDAAESVVWNGGPGPVGTRRMALAVGPKSALVAYPHSGGGWWRFRAVLLDQDLGKVLAGPIDFPLIYSQPRGVSVAHRGTSFVVAMSDQSTTVLVSRLHELTGETLGSTTVANPVSHGDPQLVTTPTGVMLGLSRGTSVGFGWAPEDVTKGGFAMRDVYSTRTASAAAPVAIDARRAVIAWQDGAVKIAPLVCGP